MQQRVYGLVGVFLVSSLVVVGVTIATWLWRSALVEETAMPVPATRLTPVPGTTTGAATLETLLRSATPDEECRLTFAEDSDYREGSLFRHDGRVRVDVWQAEVVVSLVATATSTLAWQVSSVTALPPHQLTLSPTLLTLPVQYECQPWVVDPSVFALPPNLFVPSDVSSR